MDVEVEIILTYDAKPQEFFNIVIKDNITEKNFILCILHLLGKDAHDLIKISCCQYCDNVTELLPFIAKTRGKYYFNTEINKDTETQKWRTVRDNFIIHINKTN